jgi:hypothetical protein
MNFPQKIPTLVGILLVLMIVGTVIFFTERALRAPSSASGSLTPKNVKMTNMSDNTFTVSWVTESPATGTLLVTSSERSNRIYYDERDANGKLGSFTAHMVSVRDAKPNTEYSFRILSNGKEFKDSDKTYALRTPATLPSVENGLEPAYGTIRTPDGLPAEGALVYLTLEGGQELSALTKPTGLWLIPLAQVRTADLRSSLPPAERTDETILISHQTGDSSVLTDSLNDSPVPDVTTGQVYDFRKLNANKPTAAPLALATPPPAQPTQPAVGGAVLGTTTNKVTLSTPAQNAALPTTLPLFSGTGVPEKFISLTIGITQPISGSVKVKADGTWSFTPPKHISPGKQSVTITTVDTAGKTVAITHAFEVLKSGTQVLGDATPSGTLTISPTPTIFSTISGTPTPTTPVSTLSGEELPTSGNELPTILLLVIGMGLLLSGAVAFAF